MSSENGVLDAELEMVTKHVGLGGRQLTLETYNGQLPRADLADPARDNLRIRPTNQIVPVEISTNNVLLLPYCTSQVQRSAV